MFDVAVLLCQCLMDKSVLSVYLSMLACIKPSAVLIRDFNWWLHFGSGGVQTSSLSNYEIAQLICIHSIL